MSPESRLEKGAEGKFKRLGAAKRSRTDDKVLKRIKLMVGATAMLLVSFACLEKSLAQQSTAGSPGGEPKKPEAEATLFPVPDFTASPTLHPFSEFV
jgi:hypothetical protein